jgi:inner membrane transporter RhtA
VLQVGFGFDDPSGQLRAAHVRYQNFAEQPARQCYRVARHAAERNALDLRLDRNLRGHTENFTIGSFSNAANRHSFAGPLLILLASMLCFQAGAALAKNLFPLVGATGATALRTGLAAVMLFAVWRPWRVRCTWTEARTIILYGLSMGWMNLCFYASLKTIPLGIAVALEFTGPLAVAVAASRRPLDYLWIAMAIVGLLALLPLHIGAQRLDPFGIALALGAVACWALYIVFGRKAGAAHGGQITALGMLVSALMIVPIGLAVNGKALLSPAVLPIGIGVALISSALPYSLEMIAMPRIPTRTLGVVLSLDPALGAVSGLIFLGESLSWLQWAAIACIMAASAGSATSHAVQPLPN